MFLLLSNLFEANAQIYSFEDGIVPSSWTTSTGTLTVVSNKYKLGTKSIRWNWVANSKITITNPYNLASASIIVDGGINLWVYNTTASSLNHLVFSGLNGTTPKCFINFNLNFKGWRCLWAKFAEDMGHNKTPLTSITIQAPPIGSGTFYFDFVEFTSKVSNSKNSDAQYTVKQLDDIDDFQGVRSLGNVVAAVSPAANYISSADTIIKRLDEWFLSKNAYPTAPEIVSRKNAIDNWVDAGKITANSVVLTADTDGAVTGNGLLYTGAPSIIDNSPAYNFLDYTNRMLPLAFDYRMNTVSQSKTQLLKMLDWFNDQGWADGSGIGSLMYEKLGVSGYIHSVFLMRNDMGTRLAREVNTLNWISMFGSACTTFSHTGDNADEIRTMVMAKLYAAVLQSDPNKRVTALTKLTAYYNNAFAPAPGFAETFKPDFSGYHHYGPYLGAYYSDALYSACLVYYLLHNTPYALSTSTFNQLKNSLLTYRLFCGNYDVPSASNGRFPGNTTKLSVLLPCFAYLALSQPTPDKELLAAFSKYWTPTLEPIKGLIANATNDITHKKTLGEIELCVRAAKMAVPAEKNVKTSFYMPYSGLLVNRSDSYLSTVNGYGLYVAGFESVVPNDNLYGRYLHYGQIEYTSLKDGRQNNAYNSFSWDWSRIPGATTKHLSKSKLYYLTTGSRRVFGDQPYLGGAALNDSTSAFSFRLHDNKFDDTFFANKSVFKFGNALVCLGSNINNTASTDTTETTLLQQLVSPSEIFTVNGTQLTSTKKGLTQPVIRDNLGNSFIVKTGSVNVYKGDTLYTAVISHGINPTGQTYAYYMLLQSNSAQDTKYCNAITSPIQIVRQDTIAHIVKQKEDKVWGYSVFNSSVLLNDSLVKQVNSPSILMIKAISPSTYRVVITDPDMHRSASISVSAMDAVTQVATSIPFNYQIIINGIYKLALANPNYSLTVIGNTTKIAFNVQEGNSYTFDLVPYLTPIDTVETNQNSLTCVKNGANNFTLSNAADEMFNASVYSIEGNLIKQINNIKSSYDLDVQFYAKGIYIVKLNCVSSKLVKKICVN